MKRRAKLNLNPQQGPVKRQADFVEHSGDDTDDRKRTSKVGAESQAAQAGVKRQPRVSTATEWLAANPWLKTALVVAAAGLTIYLLKRRFLR
jgi:hypothetical protein